MDYIFRVCFVYVVFFLAPTGGVFFVTMHWSQQDFFDPGCREGRVEWTV